MAKRPLYQMLETVRAFAAHEVTVSGERENALAGLARYCTAEAARAAEELFGWRKPGMAGPRARRPGELPRALTWLIERGRPADAANTAWG